MVHITLAQEETQQVQAELEAVVLQQVRLLTMERQILAVVVVVAVMITLAVQAAQEL